jgi:hypothetical protein
MATHVKRVLVSLCLVLVLESVATEAALILLFSFVSTELFSCLKLLGLLGTAFAHVEPLELGSRGLGHLGELPRAGA